MSYSREFQIEFNHCDPAGIVFFPRYHEMLNSVVENFFAAELGRPFAQISVRDGCGVPTVRLQTEFRRPSHLGEVLRFSLRVAGVGRSSADFLIDAHGRDDGALRLVARQRIVWVGRDRRAASWPDDLRSALLARIDPEAAEEKR